jgi:hypothetical protein
MHAPIVALTCPLPPCNLTVQDVESLWLQLAFYLEPFLFCFARSDQHVWAHRYLLRGMQAFISESP